MRAVSCAQQGSASALSPRPTVPRLLPSQSIKRGTSPGRGRCIGNQDPWEKSVLNGTVYLGSFIATFGVGRPCIISHLRENLCSTDVIDCFFFLTCHTSAEPHGLRCCKHAKIIVLFYSRCEIKKTPNNG